MDNKVKDKKRIYFRIIFVIISILILFLWYNIFMYNNVKNDIKKGIETTQNLKEAYFAWGCFWCVESSYEKYKRNWIIDVISGYAWGTLENATYNKVWKWDTLHREAVKVIYNADIISYNDLLEIFWRTVNPTDSKWQYVDRWFQYTSAIYYVNDSEKKAATSSLIKIQDSWRYWDKKIVTPIIKYTTFFSAEEYHQDYHIKNPVRYNIYTNWSWRKEFLLDTWWDELDYTFLKTKNIINNKNISMNYKWDELSKLQYKVTQESYTEQSFNNEYWDNSSEWIYVDIIDGTPLYSSIDKYKSDTGWPSFTKPIDINNIEEKEDKKLFNTRIEIIWAKSKSHIWHVFNDWPSDKWWLRYCMNSASMLFIDKDDLEKEWYWEYLKLFK